jgi:hypothetical protein
VVVLVAGSGCAAVADQAAKVAGVSKVLVADNAAYAHQLAENMGLLIAELGKGYSHILASASSNGKNALPRAAALLDVGQISEITAVVSADTFVRPIYAGNAIATVQSGQPIKVITVRATGFDAAAEGGSAAVEAVGTPTMPAFPPSFREELAKSDRPELTAAKSSSPAAAACRTVRTSSCSKASPTSWAPPSVPRAPPSMPVSCPTTCRSDRPARSWPPSFTSPSASPAPSSTWPA